MREANGQAFDPRPALREGIAELCESLHIRLNLIRGMTDLGDDVGLAYAFRCARAEFKAISNLVRDLCELLEAERHAELEAVYTELGKAEAPQCD